MYNDSMKFLRVVEGLRINAPDFKHAVFNATRDAAHNLVSIFTNNSPGDNRVGHRISGLQLSVSGTTLTASPGKFITGSIVDQVVVDRVYLDAQASRSIDLSTFPDGNYNVFARIDYTNTDFLGRSKINSTVSNPVEFTETIPTRITEDWFLVVTTAATASPANVLLGTVQKTGSLLTPSTIEETLFDKNGTLTDADWGAISDRNPNPARLISSLKGFTTAVQRQIQDILGTPNWFDAVPVSLTSLNASVLDLINTVMLRDGSTLFSNVIQFTESGIDQTGLKIRGLGGTAANQECQITGQQANGSLTVDCGTTSGPTGFFSINVLSNVLPLGQQLAINPGSTVIRAGAEMLVEVRDRIAMRSGTDSTGFNVFSFQDPVFLHPLKVDSRSNMLRLVGGIGFSAPDAFNFGARDANITLVIRNDFPSSFNLNLNSWANDGFIGASFFVMIEQDVSTTITITGVNAFGGDALNLQNGFRGHYKCTVCATEHFNTVDSGVFGTRFLRITRMSDWDGAN